MNIISSANAQISIKDYRSNPSIVRPGHLCLTSSLYAVHQLDHNDRSLSDEEYDARERARIEARDKRRAARAIEIATARAEREATRKEEKAREKKLRDDRARKNKELYLEQNRERRLAYKRAYARAAREREVASKKIELDNKIPRGYVKPINLELINIKVSTIVLAINNGKIPAIKIGRFFYCDEAAAIAYDADFSKRMEEKNNRARDRIVYVRSRSSKYQQGKHT